MADTEHEIQAISNTDDLHTRNSLKPPSQDFRQKENVKPGKDNCGGRKGSEQWSGIECPQFVDFNNLPEIGDSFFNRVTVIVSTPNPNFENGKLPNSFEKEDTLIAAVNHASLSGIEHDPHKGAPYIFNNGNEKSEEDYVVHDASCTGEKRGGKGNFAKMKKPQTTTVNPFTFDLRQKQRQEHKQERIDRIREEEKKMKVFRANPVPKFLKVRSVPPNANKHKSNETRNDRNDKIESSANVKGESTNSFKNPIKKNTEVWKKPPFAPSLTKKSSARPKTPPLRSASRAQERKRFDNMIKEREMQREQARQMASWM
ncbi:uncharacterized protein LOC143372948 isoform X2 [Andrena cerasifolii]|uniref:uncharacterized protein LOC143372948 isoform X2 n=1 Tax=Andrena cerasifolii TaxID=2819439 RepID=UPI004037B35E